MERAHDAGATSEGQLVLDLLARGAFDEARQLASRSLEDAPEDAELRALLARAHVHLGDIDEAESMLRALVAERPDDLAARVSLALVLLRKGAVAEGAAQLECVVTACPGHERAWGYFGVALELLGRVTEAEQALLAGRHVKAARQLRARHSDAPDTRAARITLAPDLPVESAPMPAVPGIAAPRAPRFVETLRPPELLAALETPPLGRELPAEAVLEQGSPPKTLLDVALSALVVFDDEPHVRAHASGLLTIGVRSTEEGEVSFCSRVAALQATSGTFRRDAFVHAQVPFARFSGTGHLVLAPADGARLVPLQMDHETAYVRADRLAGYDGKLLFDTAVVRLPRGRSLPLMRFRGDGVIVLELERPIVAVDVRRSHLSVLESALLGWLGQLTPEPDESSPGAPATTAFVLLRGEGTVLLNGPRGLPPLTYASNP